MEQSKKYGKKPMGFARFYNKDQAMKPIGLQVTTKFRFNPSYDLSAY